jgi:TRAP-type C4-dicarboxylate transport system substrate-binding protein
MTTRTPAAMLVLAVTTSLVAGACSGGDKAGGSGAKVVLTMANTSSEMSHQLAVEHFAARVAKLSGGEVRIKPENEWGNFDSDAERQVVRAVAAGKVDLGWVGSRVFDTLGVTSFQALTAPMLVDSYELQGAVIDSTIARRMMRGVESVGVVGLGVVPDSMRKPIGVEKPLRGPSDWRGITFGTFPSKSQEASIKALEATPAEVFGHKRADALKAGNLGGFELGLHLYQGNPEWLQSAPYVTANVNLWPQTDVLMADPSQFKDLTDQQRGWLRKAAADAAGDAKALADRDDTLIQKVCDAGGRMANASDVDLGALRKAFAPVYASLERDSETKALISRIRALKRSTQARPSPAIPDGCTGKAAVQDTSAGAVPAHLNGTYRYVLTQADADKAGDTDTGYPIVTTITLKDGTIKGGCFEAGTYSVVDKRITFHSNAYNTDSTVTMSRDSKGNLDLTPVPPMDQGDAFSCFSKTWKKIS